MIGIIAITAAKIDVASSSLLRLLPKHRVLHSGGANKDTHAFSAGGSAMMSKLNPFRALRENRRQ
jgi:hypothetical protein